MNIDFTVYENSNVKQTSEKIDILQGENNYTKLCFTLPQTIMSYGIAEFAQKIAFESDKGDVLYFDMTDGEFDVTSAITAFKSVLVQITLTKQNIKWRSKPFKLEFKQSINAIDQIGD